MKARFLFIFLLLVGLVPISVLHAQVQYEVKKTETPVETTTDERKSQTEEQFYISVEQMPEFVGGQEKLMAYINHEVHYPSKSKEKGIQGTVYIGFVVNSEGKITNTKVLRGVKNGDDLNAEALRVISNMPDWIPGKNNGKNVSVQFTFPIKFALSEL